MQQTLPLCTRDWSPSYRLALNDDMATLDRSVVKRSLDPAIAILTFSCSRKHWNKARRPRMQP